MPGLSISRAARGLAIRCAVLAALLPSTVSAVQVTIPAAQDNTLYQLASGTASNGVGEYIFTGRTSDGLDRRGVIRFDVASAVPAGATINSVSLQMHVSRTKNNTLRATTLHRVLASWGEGTSNAGQNEGQGAAPTTDDATWIHRFYPGTLWTAAGGDFAATASATVLVSGNGSYTWTAGTLPADVQAWLDTPAANFGWLMRGDESVIETAKRFDSRENGQIANRPSLIVDYTPGGGGATGACCYSDTCEVMTASACATLSGTYQGDGTVCTPNPCPPPGTTTATLIADHDNTLYQDAGGVLSNGSGTRFIVSKGTGNLLRRGVVHFDLSGIPAGATIQSATLTMYNVEGATNSANVTVHRANASWGEGASVATGSEETGAPAAAGDATWVHRFSPSTTWTTAGGDYVATESALLAVGAAGSYSWSTAALLADVVAWHAGPGTNFGWVVRGKETGAANAVKRFETRESSDSSHRPRLVITYNAAPPVPTGACCQPSGDCAALTAAECAAASGVYQGDNTVCSPNPCPVVLTPYVDELPRPAVAVPVSGVPGGEASYVIPIREVSQKLHRDLPPTRVWGYGGSYPGPTIETTTDQPVTVTWWNDLRDSSGALRTTHYLPVDMCLNGPDTEGATARVVTHLHGGHVPAAVDGYPDSTFLPGEQRTYVYPNHQQAGTPWYHDHAMGITRLNVMMGLAGFWLIRDPVENALGLPAGEFEIGLAIQDRSFHPNGSLVYPETWMEHFEGDKILVNGKVWPYLEVKQGKYRFRMLNGCNSRFLRLSLSNGAPLTVIGNDLGLLPAPVARETLLISNGERYDVVIDFSSYPPGTQIVLTNDAPAMFPGTPGVGVIPNVMRFDVIAEAGHTAPLPASLRPVPPISPGESILTRDLVLKKGSNPCTGPMWTINDLGFDDVTERPVLGTTEIWRFINDSGISHPMHMHLVQFQILDRQPFTRVNGQIVPTGSAVPPPPSERGWKDTAPVAPNEILRVIARFEDYAGKYPYHCHILEHEDHEMMRQFESILPPSVSIRDTSAQEGAGSMDFAVTLSSPVPVEVRVLATTGNGSALAGDDYSAKSDTVTFAPGVTIQTFSVPLLDEGAIETDETFTVQLGALLNAALGDSVATGTIVNDDGPVGVGDDLPAIHYLGRGVPNPFATDVTLRWGLSTAATADLTISDLQGRRIRRLVHGSQTAGHKTTRWDGRDERGNAVATGVYLVRLKVAGNVYTDRILRLR